MPVSSQRISHWRTGSSSPAWCFEGIDEVGGWIGSIWHAPTTSPPEWSSRCCLEHGIRSPNFRRSASARSPWGTWPSWTRTTALPSVPLEPGRTSGAMPGSPLARQRRLPFRPSKGLEVDLVQAICMIRKLSVNPRCRRKAFGCRRSVRGGSCCGWQPSGANKGSARIPPKTL